MRGTSLVALIWALCCGFLVSAYASSTSAPAFALSATSVTMPPSGDTSLPYTLTSLNGYAGDVAVACTAVNAPAKAKVPACSAGPARAPIALAAGQTVQGSLPLSPYGVPYPAVSAAAFGVMALSGWSLLRQGRARRTGALVALSALAGLGAVSACGGGNSNSMTPGTYAYTLQATDTGTNAFVTTTANVTVR